MSKIIKIPSALVYETKVVGVSKLNDDESSRQELIKNEVVEGDLLTLATEPTNSYDPNAVKVLSKAGNQIGYLNKEMAEKVKPALDNNTHIQVFAKWVSGKEILGVGLRIELVS